MLSLAVKLKNSYMLLSPPPLPPPKRQKSKRKQNKTQPLSNLTCFCCDERCANEQWNIIDTKCSPLPLLYTLIKVVNSKDIYCCARLKLCGRNSKSFCHACLHSFFRVVWGKYGKQIHFNIQKKLPRVGSRARVIYIELGFPGTNIDPQLG